MVYLENKDYVSKRHGYLLLFVFIDKGIIKVLDSKKGGGGVVIKRFQGF